MSVCVGNLRVIEIVMWLAAVGRDIRECPALLSAFLSESRVYSLTQRPHGHPQWLLKIAVITEDPQQRFSAYCSSVGLPLHISEGTGVGFFLTYHTAQSCLFRSSILWSILPLLFFACSLLSWLKSSFHCTSVVFTICCRSIFSLFLASGHLLCGLIVPYLTFIIGFISFIFLLVSNLGVFSRLSLLTWSDVGILDVGLRRDLVILYIDIRVKSSI